MSYLRVHRSVITRFVVGLVGIVLIFTALDLMWGHWLSTPPERVDGALTTRGRGQLGSDVVWGVVLTLTGGAAFGYAVVGLLRNAPAAVVGEGGIELALAGPTAPLVTIPWSDVVAVRCSLEADGDHMVPILELVMARRGAVPAEPWAARWDGNVLQVDTSDWVEPAEEVAIHASVALDRYRRQAAER